MSWLNNLLSKIDTVFHSPAVKAAEQTIETLVPIAAPIVADIASLTPNRTVQEIASAYQQYAVPFSQQILQDPSGAGNALLNLATTVLKANHAPTAATSLVQTAVQLAYVGYSAMQAAKTPQPAAPAETPKPPAA